MNIFYVNVTVVARTCPLLAPCVFLMFTPLFSVLLAFVAGELKKADNWKERFSNMNRNLHNSLRISRILQFLMLAGFQRFMLPFLSALVDEILAGGAL